MICFSSRIQVQGSKLVGLSSSSRHIRERSQMTSDGFGGFWTPSPLCPKMSDFCQIRPPPPPPQGEFLRWKSNTRPCTYYLFCVSLCSSIFLFSSVCFVCFFPAFSLCSVFCHKVLTVGQRPTPPRKSLFLTSHVQVFSKYVHNSDKIVLFFKSIVLGAQTIFLQAVKSRMKIDVYSFFLCF